MTGKTGKNWEAKKMIEGALLRMFTEDVLPA
jgi:hypothetical protein